MPIPPMSPRLPRAASGFTLVELIVTMILVTILAAYAAPKFLGRHGFEGRGFADQLLTVVQDARRTAIAQRRLVCVTASGAGVDVSRATAAGAVACNETLANPYGNGDYVLPVPASVTPYGAPLTVNFDALGRPSGTLAFPVNSSEGNFNLVIEAETGYAYGHHVH